jgi:hypothetical protein
VQFACAAGRGAGTRILALGRKTTAKVQCEITHPGVESGLSSRSSGKGGQKVKRVGVALGTAAMMVVMTAGQAMAQYPPSKAPGIPSGANDPSVAFTGTNITLGLVILAALVVVGTFLLVIGRRRRVSASN